MYLTGEPSDDATFIEEMKKYLEASVRQKHQNHYLAKLSILFENEQFDTDAVQEDLDLVNEQSHFDGNINENAFGPDIPRKIKQFSEEISSIVFLLDAF